MCSFLTSSTPFKERRRKRLQTLSTGWVTFGLYDLFAFQWPSFSLVHPYAACDQALLWLCRTPTPWPQMNSPRETDSKVGKEDPVSGIGPCWLGEAWSRLSCSNPWLPSQFHQELQRKFGSWSEEGPRVRSEGGIRGRWSGNDEVCSRAQTLNIINLFFN